MCMSCLIVFEIKSKFMSSCDPRIATVEKKKSDFFKKMTYNCIFVIFITIFLILCDICFSADLMKDNGIDFVYR
jgi:hypothetical protein